MTPVTKEQVMTALTECYDPEIPVNIVDLGLIYDVRFQPASSAVPANDAPTQDVEVEMTMTSPGCPAHVGISEDVRRKVLALPGVNAVNVNIVWNPPWGPERLSPAARQKLGIE
ncbi:MAG TPA: metal-sulfur cluster assembly factor [Alphaproteobacteria bacterium]|nr:metal-sulfur cluster assembly factor [Alphaproteobacteria bacterium]